MSWGRRVGKPRKSSSVLEQFNCNMPPVEGNPKTPSRVLFCIREMCGYVRVGQLARSERLGSGTFRGRLNILSRICSSILDMVVSCDTKGCGFMADVEVDRCLLGVEVLVMKERLLAPKCLAIAFVKDCLGSRPYDCVCSRQ